MSALYSTSIVKLLVYNGFFIVATFSNCFAQANEKLSLLSFEDIEQQLNLGEYESALRDASIGRQQSPYDDQWWQLEARAHLALGQYENAQVLLQEIVNRNYRSIRLRLLAREAGRFAQMEEFADEQLFYIRRLLRSREPSVYSLDELVALGEAALLLGVEPKIVLTNFYKRAQNEPTPPISAFLASGRLALQKHDAELASRSFQQGLKHFPDNPDLLHGLASSFLNGDRSQLMASAEHALSINPRHTPSLVLIAEHMIDSESFSEAENQLDKALEVNPRLPEALSLKAVIAYLRNTPEIGDKLREDALATWTNNPKVDYLIGKKLSQKYWFKEGASFQQKALRADESFLPARIQLAQDLLRLGIEDKGWSLAAKAHEDDPYDIAAYNLVSLHDKLEDFTSLYSDHFRLKMSKTEAPIYGQQALDLLEESYTELSLKYGITLDGPVTVEIYPNPSDFAVRTFGMPGNPGYLGVCFGDVFTMNSPASSKANWEAVLFHEFCHVITLNMTNNKMPRWLSEGISVYEERLKNGSWGQMMSVDYRNRILEGNMQKISEMSAAFLKAKTGQDTQFAYYQSALVVRFLFEEYGLDSIRSVLKALGEGHPINETLEEHIAPLKELDTGFIQFARNEAKMTGGNFQFTKNETTLQSVLSAVTDKKNYFEQLEAGIELMSQKRWLEARTQFEELIQAAGYFPREANAHIHLAKVYEQLGETALEIQTLTSIAENEGDRLETITRLFVIARLNENWTELTRWSNAWRAINPMAITPVRSLMDAQIELNNSERAIATGKILIELSPPDIAKVHYQVAMLLQATDHSAAHRHTLMALEEAPRFRLAYQLLDTLNNTKPTSTPQGTIPTAESLENQMMNLLNSVN